MKFDNIETVDTRPSHRKFARAIINKQKLILKSRVSVGPGTELYMSPTHV